MRLRSVLAFLPVFGILLSGCGSGSGTTSLPTSSPTTNITVTVSPAATQNIDAGQTVSLTATVGNDQGAKGVQWTVSPGGGTLASTTGLTNTYTAPAIEAMGVSVAATSVADPTKSATVTVNVFAAPVLSTLSPLPGGYAGINYSTTLTAVGGVGAKTISLASGTLPPGLTLSAAGVLSGKPTTVGTYTFAARVVDSAVAPVAATATYTVSIATLAINPIQLQGGVMGTVYPATTLTSSAAIGAVTYTVDSGALPAGLTLSTAGVLSGTPTAMGTSNFVVRATDAGGQTTTAALTITVATKLTFANVALPAANRGTAIANYQFQPAGGTQPYSFAVGAGSALPAGLSLTTSGLLYGTPTTAGNYTFTVTTTDGGTTTGGATPPKQAATATVTLSVGAFVLTSSTLPAATQNFAYSATLQTSGGTAPYVYAITAGALPAGVTLNPATGVISGTPTASGSFGFTVTVTDAAGRQASAGYTLQVAPPVTFTTATTLPGTIANTAYSATVQASGGTAPYTYTGGSSLPAGLALNGTTGAITGTPTTAGSYSFSLTATDASGATGTATFTLTVASQLAFANVTLPAATANNAIANYTFSPTGGTAPYTFTVATGSTLPAGLTLSTSGVLSGAPTTAGSYTFGVTATDSGSTTAGSSTAPQQTATSTVTLTVAPTYYITTTTLPNVVVNSPYSFTTNVTGGTGPYTYTVISGALPTGITLDSTLGKLQGTTTATVGPYNFTEQVTDANNNVTTKALTLNVSTVLTPGVNNALLNGSYAFTFTGFTNGSMASTQYGTASVGVLTFDGTTGVTGSYDANSAVAGYLASQTISNGSYRLNADNRGTIVFTTNGQTTTFTITVSQVAGGAAAQIKLLEFDDQDPTDPAQLIGGGTALKQSGTLSTASLTGKYVFDLKGETGGTPTTSTTFFGPFTGVGFMTLDGAGTITGGAATTRAVNGAAPANTLTGTYAVADAVLGRGTMVINTLSSPSNVPHGYVYYFVSPTQIYLMSTDSHASVTGNYTLLSGPARQQVAQTFSTSSLSGTVIAYGSGSKHSTAASTYTTTPDQTYSGVYNVAVTSPGNVTINGYTNTAGVTAALAQSTATYTVNGNGLVTFSPAVLPPFYLVDSNVGVAGSFPANVTGVGLMRLEPQTATTLTDGTFALTSQQTTARSYGFLGTTTTANSGMTASESVNYVLFDQPQNERLFTQTRAFNTTYTVNATTGLIQLGPTGNNYTGYVINGGKFVTLFVNPGTQQYETAVTFEQ